MGWPCYITITDIDLQLTLRTYANKLFGITQEIGNARLKWHHMHGLFWGTYAPKQSYTMYCQPRYSQVSNAIPK